MGLPRRVLLTGGAGFIGSHVAEAYLREGIEVAVVDDLSSGRQENLPEGARFYRVDVRDRVGLEEVFKAERPEVVNHHAAQIDVRRSVEDPVFDASVNVVGSLNLLELSVKYGVSRFVFASTGGAIYGEPKDLPADESTPPAPLSPYGTSKLCVENYLGYYHRVWGLNYVSLRYGNVYGPRQDPHGEAGVVAIFCGRILSGKPCVVFGDGTQTRDYVYVEDVARVNVLALTSPVGVFNVGTGLRTSVLDLLKALKAVSGREVAVEFAPERRGEVKHISLCGERARRVLGFSPSVGLEEGIRRTFAYFESFLSR